MYYFDTHKLNTHLELLKITSVESFSFSMPILFFVYQKYTLYGGSIGSTWLLKKRYPHIKNFLCFYFCQFKKKKIFLDRPLTCLLYFQTFRALHRSWFIKSKIGEQIFLKRKKKQTFCSENILFLIFFSVKFRRIVAIWLRSFYSMEYTSRHIGFVQSLFILF